MNQNYIVDVLIPVPVNEPFSYLISVPPELLIGCRVVVPFGQRKHITGIIIGTKQQNETDYALKEVTEVLDDEPVITSNDLRFWHWIADYYMCTIGEVMLAALPGGLLVESNSILTLNQDYESDTRFEGNEAKVYEWLTANKKGELKQIEKSLGIKNTFRSLRKLLDSSAVVLEENVRERYKTKTETFVTVADMFRDDEVLDAFFSSLSRAPVQEQVMISYFSLSEEENDPFVPRQHLTKGGKYTAYRALVKKGALVEHEIEISRLEEKIPVTQPHPLTSWQSEALRAVQSQFEHKSVVLLKGASASGKTEIYIHLIKEQIAKGKQVLMLVPEISLTTQLSKRLKRVFGAEMAVFHSRFNFDKRTELWKRISKDSPVSLVLGARSALFLPFGNLGLIIIDEEHERSLKQQEPAPRYLARDAAVMLADMRNTKVLLGSATPSAESLHNVYTAKYGYVELQQRFGDAKDPEIKIVDLTQSYKKKKLKYHFSYELIDEMNRSLEAGKQIILFQNRRGYAPVVECRACGWVQKCTSCDVPMTWHFDKHLMGCHYCGSTRNVIRICPSCGEEALMNKGFGTEKVEEEIRDIFPDAVSKRFDADTTGGIKKMEKLLTEFEDGEVDILIGTQMISRGLDFENVGLVGVLNADNLLNFPEFRASERALQMLTQVSGRAGRRSEQGKVLIQTHQPDHPVIRALLSGQFITFIKTELEERQLFKYPPYNRVIDVIIRHTDQNVLHQAALTFGQIISKELGRRVLGPEVPAIGKIKGMFQERLLVKSFSAGELKWIKNVLIKGMQLTLKQKNIPRTIKFIFDVDPN
ncbi:primosomal protein N' [Saccharicrinis sp. FJH54]|uniref:replication restart helicase PriA n=1 Tax=Saccharicrinis sp. FJH54 TaxID=3344665 RepID=UPI0035D461EE